MSKYGAIRLDPSECFLLGNVITFLGGVWIAGKPLDFSNIYKICRSSGEVFQPHGRSNSDPEPVRSGNSSCICFYCGSIAWSLQSSSQRTPRDVDWIPCTHHSVWQGRLNRPLHPKQQGELVACNPGRRFDIAFIIIHLFKLPCLPPYAQQLRQNQSRGMLYRRIEFELAFYPIYLRQSPDGP